MAKPLNIRILTLNTLPSLLLQHTHKNWLHLLEIQAGPADASPAE